MCNRACLGGGRESVCVDGVCERACLGVCVCVCVYLQEVIKDVNGYFHRVLDHPRIAAAKTAASSVIESLSCGLVGLS